MFIRGWRLLELGLGLAFVACGDEAEAPDAVSGGEQAEQAGATRPADPLAWTPCGATECATLQVPLDRDVPDGETITIAINRSRADDDVPYRGLIIYNPGGPGLPGRATIEASAVLLRDFLPGFDVVGFDARGTGGSTPVPCTIDVDPARVYAEAGVGAAIATYGELGSLCAEGSGALLDHLGSQEVVRDIDHIRSALGHEVINFWGVSYGTRLGALYAQTFPQHTRALVLDAPMAPRADYVELVDGQFDALLLAQAAFFDACAAGELSCPAEPEAAFEQLLAAADEQEGLRDLVVRVWALSLSSPFGRQSLAQLLTSGGMDVEPAMGAVIDPGVMSLLSTLNLATNFSVHCADDATPPLDAAQGEALMASFLERSSVFVTQGVPALACAGWPGAPDPVPALAFEASVPPLVIAGSQDSLTPLAWGEEMAGALGGSRLVVSEHYGHGALAFGGPCIGSVFRSYLEDLTLPPAGTRCPAP
jgi:pimeloyl-ACP methyl ester carboxylesterase